MRLTGLIVALIAAVLLAACDRVVAAKPDPANDAAFVSGVKLLCSKTPALVPILPSAGTAAVESVANADNTIVTNFEYGVPVPTPKGQKPAVPPKRKGGMPALTVLISQASPLVLPVTDFEQMLTLMSKWYGAIAEPSPVIHPTKKTIKAAAKLLASSLGTLGTRTQQAHADLAKIGVTACLG